MPRGKERRRLRLLDEQVEVRDAAGGELGVDPVLTDQGEPLRLERPAVARLRFAPADAVLDAVTLCRRLGWCGW